MPGIPEGFGNWFAEKGEHFRDPELGPGELDGIFKPQGNRGEPRLLEPPPESLAELARVDLDTFGKLLSASLISKNLTQDGKFPQAFMLAGGLASEVWCGRMTRSHHDIDALVNRKYYKEILSLFEKSIPVEWYHSVIIDLDKLVKVSGIRKWLRNYVSKDAAKDFSPRYIMDLFPFGDNQMIDTHNGNPISLKLNSDRILKSVKRNVYNTDFYLAPLEIIKKMKYYDYRPIGRHDNQNLAAIC